MVGDAHGPVVVTHDGGLQRVTITGRITVDHFTEALGRSAELEFAQATSGILLDFSGVSEVDLTDDEVCRVVASMRRRFRRPTGFRFAVVASSAAMSRLVDEFVGVRDMLVSDSGEAPPVRSFEELAQAEAWLAEALEQAMLGR